MAFFTTPRFVSILAVAALALPAAAGAMERDTDARSVSVSTTGVDLANPAAQAVLTHRIVVAAQRLCGQPDAGTALSSEAFDQCVGSATADAKSQMQSRIAAASTRAMVASIASK